MVKQNYRDWEGASVSRGHQEIPSLNSYVSRENCETTQLSLRLLIGDEYR